MKDALGLTLGALLHIPFDSRSPMQREAIAAAREALAQPEQEPVGFVDSKLNPIKRPWVGLTDEEIEEAYAKPTLRKMYQAIEAKLKEKNT